MRLCDYCDQEIKVTERTAQANVPLMDPNAPPEYVTQLDIHQECAPEFTRKVRTIKGGRPMKPPTRDTDTTDK